MLIPSLARLYRKVVRADLRPEIAVEVARSDGPTNVSVRAGELTSHGLPDNYFDTMITASVLEHAPHLEALVEILHRLLVRGGELLVGSPSEGRFYLLGRRVFGYTKPHDHYYPAAFIENTVARRLPLVRLRYFPLEHTLAWGLLPGPVRQASNNRRGGPVVTTRWRGSGWVRYGKRVRRERVIMILEATATTALLAGFLLISGL